MSDSPKPFHLSQKAVRTSEQPITYLMAQAVSNPNMISLAAGLVDYESLPVPESAGLLSDMLRDPALGRIALQYGTTHGLAELRGMLLAHLEALDGVSASRLNATADDIIITTGSQQMLFVITDVMIDPGDIVITEWPSYFVYTGLLESAGAVVRCVDMDDQGMIPAKLDALLLEIADAGQLHRLKMIYTCDYHQNPTGLTLSDDRRPQVLEIVRKWSADPTSAGRILLLEDAAYRELTYEGMAPHSIKRYDAGNEFVALLQTFSKPFSPGVKTGYGLLPRDLVEPVMAQKGNHDFGSNNLSQHLLLAAMKSGAYAKHVKELCRVYAVKRDAMLAALKEHFAGTAAHWTHPTGGLYVYLTLPAHIHTGRHSALFQSCLKGGVIYVPGGYCYGPDSTRTVPQNTMRLSFGVSTVEQIHEGIKRLAKAVRSV
jgi:2-aminoadipate transaminase